MKFQSGATQHVPIQNKSVPKKFEPELLWSANFSFTSLSVADRIEKARSSIHEFYFFKILCNCLAVINPHLEAIYSIVRPGEQKINELTN